MESIHPNDLYRQEPPAFGRGLLKFFPLDSSFLNLNHGSYGSSPYVVHKAAHDLSLKLEAMPDKFLRLDYLKYLGSTRERLAKLVNVHQDEIVLVSNVSVGIQTVLANFEWQTEDVIICFNTTHHSPRAIIDCFGDNLPCPTISEIELKFPTQLQDIVDKFRDHIKSLPKTEGKHVAILDTITANPGALIPWQQLVKICQEENIWSIVDAAHSIGQEQSINLTEAAPDFWVSNCHKWLYTQRPVAMFYIPERNRHIIKTSYPTSRAYKPLYQRTLADFLAQWEWNGTIDWIPFLTIGTALDFRQWIGGEAKIFDYCHDLALKGGKVMAEIMGTREMDPEGVFTLNMVNVELPLSGEIPPTPKIKRLFLQKMLNERKAYSVPFYHNGRWWTRCSAQVYNELEDFEKLAKIWVEVCKEIQSELGTDEI